MIAPPPSGDTTVFAFPGNTWNTVQPLIIGNFTITGSPNYSYGNGTQLLTSNGQWSPSGEFSWLNPNASGTVLIDLGGNYQTVGGLVGYDYWANPFIEALDSTMAILETYNLKADTPVIDTRYGTNIAAFRGITRVSADIRYFRISGGGGGNAMLMHSITVDGAGAPPPPPPPNPEEVPEPANVFAGVLALVLIGVALRGR